MSVMIVLPLVLVKFEPAEVAVWQLFATLFTLMLLLDFGLSPTFSRLLAYARGGATLDEMADMRTRSAVRGAPNEAAAATIFGALRWLYPRMVLCIAAFFAVIGTLALVRPIGMTTNPQVAWLAWALVLPVSAIGFWGSVYAAALQGMNSIAVLRRWEVVTGIGQIATCLVVLLAGGGLLALVAAYQFWTLFAALRNRALLKRLHPSLFNQAAVLNRQVMRIMWPATWRSGIGVLMGQGIIQASGVIYGQLGSAAEVAAYLLALRVMTVLSQFAQAPYYSKLPRLAELQASGDHKAQLALAQRGMRLAHWVFVAGALSVAVLAQPMLTLIGSRTPFVEQGLWALVALAFFVERYGAMHLQLYSLTNHIVWHVANGVTGILMAAIASLAYERMGGYAFPFAMLVAYSCFYSVYCVLHSRAAFKLALLRFEATTALLPGVVLFGGLLACVMHASH